MPKGLQGFQKGNNLGIANTGRSPVNSIATRKKISDTQKRLGIKPPPRKEGFKCSEETKRNMSLAQMGQQNALGAIRSLETRQKISNSIKGEKHHNWKGGLTPLKMLLRHSLEYKLWRNAVFQRDNYTCIWCGIKSGNGKAVILHADHIKPFALYPELRFSIDNGRTLCVPCHKTTDTYGGKTH